MTTSRLNDEDRKDVVKYRIEKAGLAYKAALICIDNLLVATAANRLYYSAYYAVTALLIANGIQVKSHDGVRSMFGLHFIKTHIIDYNIGKTFNSLFSIRMTGDYQDRRDLDLEKDVKPLVEPTRELIDVVTKLAKEKI